MDASNGFWQIPVDKDSSKLLTFNSPFGRLPYGINSERYLLRNGISNMTHPMFSIHNQTGVIEYTECITAEG